jgi:ketosteroid isomerase-like protein
MKGSEETLPAVVATYFERCNADRTDELDDLWADDVEHVAFGRDRRRTRRGRAEVAAYYDGLFAPWAEHHDEVVRATTAAGRTTVEIRFTGRTPDGRDVSFEALDVFDVVDERIRRLVIWHDVLYTRAVLGL